MSTRGNSNDMQRCATSHSAAAIPSMQRERNPSNVGDYTARTCLCTPRGAHFHLQPTPASRVKTSRFPTSRAPKSCNFTACERAPSDRASDRLAPNRSKSFGRRPPRRVCDAAAAAGIAVADQVDLPVHTPVANRPISVFPKFSLLLSFSRPILAPWHHLYFS